MISYVKFPPNSVHHKLLKSVHFSLSYSKYNNGAFFLETAYKKVGKRLVFVRPDLWRLPDY